MPDPGCGAALYLAGSLGIFHKSGGFRRCTTPVFTCGRYLLAGDILLMALIYASGLVSTLMKRVYMGSWKMGSHIDTSIRMLLSVAGQQYSLNLNFASGRGRTMFAGLGLGTVNALV